MRPRSRSGCIDGGFTLVELLVVISVMSILIALAVPAYVGLQNAASNQATSSDLGSSRIALVGWGIDNNGLVPASTGFDPSASGLNLVGYGWSQSSQTTSYAYSTNPAKTAWCLQMSSLSGATFRVSQSTSLTAGTCSTLGASNY